MSNNSGIIPKDIYMVRGGDPGDEDPGIVADANPRFYFDNCGPIKPPVGNPGAAWIRDAKNSEGKPQTFDVLAGFALALKAVAEVSTYGYHKHTAPAREKLIREDGATKEQAEAAIPYNNWQNGTVSTYDNAQARHLLDRTSGEVRASDSGLLHRAHEAWNALAALTLELRNDPR